MTDSINMIDARLERLEKKVDDLADHFRLNGPLVVLSERVAGMEIVQRSCPIHDVANRIEAIEKLVSQHDSAIVLGKRVIAVLVTPSAMYFGVEAFKALIKLLSP